VNSWWGKMVGRSPSPLSSPSGEDFTSPAFSLFGCCSANPAAGFAKGAENVSPSPWGEGRDEGEHETNDY